MSLFKKLTTLILIIAFSSCSLPQLEAVTYVTDTGGYAWDESRAATNLAPAVALGTVAIVGIIAIAVQNSHDHSSSGHYDSYACYSHCSSSYCSSSRCSSSSSCCSFISHASSGACCN